AVPRHPAPAQRIAREEIEHRPAGRHRHPVHELHRMVERQVPPPLPVPTASAGPAEPWSAPAARRTAHAAAAAKPPAAALARLRLAERPGQVEAIAQART